MTAHLRCLAVVALLLAPGLAAAQDQPDAPTLPQSTITRTLDHYRVLLIRDGIVLTPRTGPSRSIEIRDGAIAIDGTTVSGRELRDRVGGDADLLLQLSYAAPDALRRAFMGGTTDATEPAAPSTAPPAPAPSDSEPAGVVPAPPAAPEPPKPPERPRHVQSGAKVRVGGSVNVDENEIVRDAVVAVGGSVRVDGQVDDDVVAIGGSVRLGPRAVVNGSVTAVGGEIDRAPGAVVHGEMTEVRVPMNPVALFAGMPVHWFGKEMFSSWFRFIATLLRIGLLMLVALIAVLVARTPVDRIAHRAGEDPWLSGMIGLLAQVLLIPVLVITMVVLAISIIGIPLLVLVPFALIALLFGVVLGLAGVARRIGTWAVGPDRGPLVATAVGVILITALALLTRLTWLVPTHVAPIALLLGVVAFFVEYAAWTVGLGALLLTRFGTRGPLTAVSDGYLPPIPPVPAGGPAVVD